MTVDYHYDTETGDNCVGEIDFGISGELDNYLKQYGTDGYKEITLTLSYLICVVRSRYEGIHSHEQQEGANSCE